jgi:hypothetical protein
MALPNEPFVTVVVESFEAPKRSGHHGIIHVRPLLGQGFDGLEVECAREMRYAYPVGTKFKVTAKLSDKEGGAPYLKAPYAWGFTKISRSTAYRFLRQLRTPTASSGKP